MTRVLARIALCDPELLEASSRFDRDTRVSVPATRAHLRGIRHTVALELMERGRTGERTYGRSSALERIHLPRPCHAKRRTDAAPEDAGSSA